MAAVQYFSGKSLLRGPIHGRYFNLERRSLHSGLTFLDDNTDSN